MLSTSVTMFMNQQEKNVAVSIDMSSEPGDGAGWYTIQKYCWNKILQEVSGSGWKPVYHYYTLLNQLII